MTNQTNSHKPIAIHHDCSGITLVERPSRRTRRLALHDWYERDETDFTDNTAYSTSLMHLNLVRPVTWSERRRNNHLSRHNCRGGKKQQESSSEWCYGRAKGRRVLPEEHVRVDVGLGNLNLLALARCTHRESIFFVFAHRGDDRMQTRSQKQ